MKIRQYIQNNTTKALLVTSAALLLALGWKTYEGYEQLDVILNTPVLIKNSMYTACVISINYMCSKQVDCTSIPSSELQEFCDGARH